MPADARAPRLHETTCVGERPRRVRRVILPIMLTLSAISLGAEVSQRGEPACVHDVSGVGIVEGKSRE